MSRSAYSYEIHDNVVAIEDEDMGGMSVTSNIESVIEEIAAQESIDPEHYAWIYRDTEGMWDGFDPLTNTFYRIGAETLSEAQESKQVKLRLKG